jgi:hypothetical protein
MKQMAAQESRSRPRCSVLCQAEWSQMVYRTEHVKQRQTHQPRHFSSIFDN